MTFPQQDAYDIWLIQLYYSAFLDDDNGRWYSGADSESSESELILQNSMLLWYQLCFDIVKEKVLVSEIHNWYKKPTCFILIFKFYIILKYSHFNIYLHYFSLNRASIFFLNASFQCTNDSVPDLHHLLLRISAVISISNVA